MISPLGVHAAPSAAALAARRVWQDAPALEPVLGLGLGLGLELGLGLGAGVNPD